MISNDISVISHNHLVSKYQITDNKTEESQFTAKPAVNCEGPLQLHIRVTGMCIYMTMHHTSQMSSELE